MRIEFMDVPAPRRLVLFGGPDRCGKTTIAKELSRRLHVPYFKPRNQTTLARKGPEVFRLQTVWGETKLADFMSQTGASAVIDRGVPCDWVYTRFFGRHYTWDLKDVSEWNDAVTQVDEEYASMGALFVLCHRLDYSGVSDPDWPEVTPAGLRKLDSLYHEYLQRSKMNRLVLAVDDENLDRQVSTIITALENPSWK